ncbi:MAG: hypothetical protein HOK52_10140 [Candidatus Marinimicrobia bacterium]|jgi:hypothetical protein|nr:hypothetical protein [Candidatus Neomarinimicrobiota bacterium]
MDLYVFHSNPSELIGYDSDIPKKVNSDELNYIHDMDDYNIANMIEGMMIRPLSPSFEKQFGYGLDTISMEWDVEGHSDGRIFVRGTF